MVVSHGEGVDVRVDLSFFTSLIRHLHSVSNARAGVRIGSEEKALRATRH